MIVFLGVLIFFDLVQKLLLLVTGKRFHHHAALLLNRSVRATLKLLGTTIHHYSTDSLEAGKPYIIVCNHQSMFDIPILYVFFRRHWPRFIAKRELAKNIPGISVCLRSDGSALIDRKNARQALPEIKRLGATITEGKFAAVIFPEGTRARDGVLKQFHLSGLITLLSAAPTAEVVPVAIDGSWKLQCFRKGPVPLGVKIGLKVGQPISRSEKDSKELAALIESKVRTQLEELRALENPSADT